MFFVQAKNRWQAFGYHLLVSLVLFIAMCTIIVVFWYPGVLFTTEGGWQGVRLIAGIDFVIGPTLTLIVYKVGKKGLKFDLTLIGILQVICITYGMYVVNESRPAVVAYADDIYYVVPYLRFDSREIDVDEQPLLQQRYPVWVGVDLPEDPEERLEIKLQHVQKGLETAVDRYISYKEVKGALIHEGFSIQEAIDAGLETPSSEYTDNSARVFKLYTRYGSYAVLVDTSSGEFIELLGHIAPGIPGLEPASFEKQEAETTSEETL